MATEQEQKFTFDGTEYSFSEISDKAKMLVAHIEVIEKKLGELQFQADEYTVSKGAFIQMLKEELNKSEETTEE